MHRYEYKWYIIFHIPINIIIFLFKLILSYGYGEIKMILRKYRFNFTAYYILVQRVFYTFNKNFQYKCNCFIIDLYSFRTEALIQQDTSGLCAKKKYLRNLIANADEIKNIRKSIDFTPRK